MALCLFPAVTLKPGAAQMDLDFSHPMQDITSLDGNPSTQLSILLIFTILDSLFPKDGFTSFFPRHLSFDVQIPWCCMAILASDPKYTTSSEAKYMLLCLCEPIPMTSIWHCPFIFGTIESARAIWATSLFFPPISSALLTKLER